MQKYKGFCSKRFLSTRTFVLTDKELIKQDLLNRIFCSKLRGERIMMEGYGTIIPDATFQPLDEELISSVVDGIEFAFKQDPRITLINMLPLPDYDTNSLTVRVFFDYVEISGSDQLDLNLIFNE